MNQISIDTYNNRINLSYRMLKVSYSIVKRYRRNWTTRKQLGQLSESQLKDIGVSHAQAKIESDKPFWY